MISPTNKEESKLFLIKTYTNLLHLENAIRNIVQNDQLDLQLSILGKPAPYASKDNIGLDDMIKAIRSLPNMRFQVGYFSSPELGKLLIAGHLKDTFMRRINDKALASLPAGLYGIFRAIGIDIEEIDRYREELQNRNFLLIIRGDTNSLSEVENVL